MEKNESEIIKSNIKEDLLLLFYGKLKLYVKREEAFVFYATFIAGEYDNLNIRKGDIVIDFGDNVGDFTVKAALRVGDDGKVIVIEPDPKNIEIIKLNAQINHLRNIIIVNAAVADRIGFAYLSGSGVGAYISDKRILDTDIEVPLITMDEILKRYADDKNVVIKMDIEGAERMVFKNTDFLNRVREIAIELHGEDNIKNIRKIFEMYGYKIKVNSLTDELIKTLKQILSHPIDFISNERKTKYIALNGFASVLLHKKNPIPSLSNDNLEIVRALQIGNISMLKK